ncbi:MAG: hydrogenase maturation nickel metallochaperone HypA [Rhodocyclaceae bacterium]|nr:hydrogenase maturation nickel metallochaperone HypA [Rhodocyclaceae bacterium]MBX3668040.1 hydrogenase maturation nickel metallochaperone HypA [Rhodocyclaceae bacterium]
MHELGIARNIVAICTEHAAAGARVVRVTLEIGRLSAVMPDALRFCFDACTRDTPLAGAELDIIDTPGRARCRACGAEIALAERVGLCACGSTDLQIVAGEELKIRSMEVL